MKKPKDTSEDKASKALPGNDNSQGQKTSQTTKASPRKPEEFEEERSMDIRMKPQPLKGAKGKPDNQ